MHFFALLDTQNGMEVDELQRYAEDLSHEIKTLLLEWQAVSYSTVSAAK